MEPQKEAVEEQLETPSTTEESSEDSQSLQETDSNASTQNSDNIAKLNERILELEDTVLRMAAENQNTRKRLVKQQQDAYRYRHQDILNDLAGVIDNLERAIESSEESRDFDAFHEGIVMIEKQFTGMLTEKYSLMRIGTVGEVFNPATHEAMMMEESGDVEEATVTQVFQAGYSLHERVLRPAKVVVARPRNPQSIQEDDDQQEKDGD